MINKGMLGVSVVSAQHSILADAEYAGFNRRFQALLLDGLVVALPSLLIALALAGVWYSIDSYWFREVNVYRLILPVVGGQTLLESLDALANL